MKPVAVWEWWRGMVCVFCVVTDGRWWCVAVCRWAVGGGGGVWLCGEGGEWLVKDQSLCDVCCLAVFRVWTKDVDVDVNSI